MKLNIKQRSTIYASGYDVVDPQVPSTFNHNLKRLEWNLIPRSSYYFKEGKRAMSGEIGACQIVYPMVKILERNADDLKVAKIVIQEILKIAREYQQKQTGDYVYGIIIEHVEGSGLIDIDFEGELFFEATEGKDPLEPFRIILWMFSTDLDKHFPPTTFKRNDNESGKSGANAELVSKELEFNDLNPRDRVAISFSGGQDSTTILFDNLLAGERKFLLIEFLRGSRAQALEDEAKENIINLVKQTLPTVDIIRERVNIEPVFEARNKVMRANGSVNVVQNKGRNLIFATAAMHIAEIYNCKTLNLGITADDDLAYADDKPETIASLQAAFDHTLFNCKLETPLIHNTKVEHILARADSAIFREMMTLTYSCYNAIPGGCNTCSSCLLRAEALSNLYKD